MQRVAADDLPPANLLRAVAGLEQSRSPEDVLQVVEALQRWLRHPRATELQRAFADWVRQMIEREAPAGTVLPSARTLEDVRMALVERKWVARMFQEAREAGLAEGREQGLEQQRDLLCTMAAARFGADTAAHLAGVLAPIAEPERLAEVGDWLVRCETSTVHPHRLSESIDHWRSMSTILSDANNCGPEDRRQVILPA